MKLATLILCLLSPMLSFGQQWAFYGTDNSNQRVFKKNQVRLVEVLTKTYLGNGDLREEYTELTQTIDRNGMIVSEKKLYNDSTVAFEATYVYNDQLQMIRSQWVLPGSDLVETIQYEYDSENRLVKSCLSQRLSIDDDLGDLIDFGCDQYHYKNNRLEKVTNPEGDLRSYYETSGDTILSYNHRKSIKYKYVNGQPVYYRPLDSIIYYFDRNEIGLLLKETKTDDQQDIKSISTHEYANGLLTKVTTRNQSGVLLKTEAYAYKYYDQ